MGSKIREKFVEHMEFFGLAKQTQRGYISGVRCLANPYNQSPERLTDDQGRAYFHHLILVRKLAWTSCKTYLSGITYFYRHICNREVDDRFGLPPRPRGKKLPAVLSMEEVSRLLSCRDQESAVLYLYGKLNAAVEIIVADYVGADTLTRNRRKDSRCTG